MAADISGDGVLGPLPVLERLREELQLARRRGKPAAGNAVHHHAVRLRLLMGTIDVVLNEERAVLAHVRERGQPLRARRLRQARHAVLEDPAVHLLDAELLPRPVRRLEVLPDAERAVGVDAPRELDPEFVLLPDLAEAGRLVRLPGEVERLAASLERHAQDGLAKADPAGGVGLL